MAHNLFRSHNCIYIGPLSHNLVKDRGGPVHEGGPLRPNPYYTKSFTWANITCQGDFHPKLSCQGELDRSIWPRTYNAWECFMTKHIPQDMTLITRNNCSGEVKRRK